MTSTRLPYHRLRQIAQGLVVLSLCVSIGLHWVVLQSAAWVGMAVTYSVEKGVVEGLSETFDGEHPCKMCKIVKQGRQAEQEKPAALKLESKMELFYLAQVVTIYAPHFLDDDARISSDSSSRQDPPLLRLSIFA